MSPARFFRAGAGLLCLCLALLCGLSPWLREWDGRFLDQAFRVHQRLGGRPASGPEVVIVGLDEASMRAIPEPMALYHRPLGQFMEAMAQARPAAVGLDIILPEQAWTQFVQGQDAVLGLGLLRLKRATHLVLGRTVGDQGVARPVYPPFVALAGADSFAFVQCLPDEDRVVRRFENRLGERGAVVPTLAGEMARPFGKAAQPGLIHFALGQPFRYVPLKQVLDWREQGQEQELARAFGGKLVLLGSVIPYEDRFRLPVRLAAWEDPSNSDSPGVLLQAQILRTLLAGASIRSLPDWGLVLLAGLWAWAGLALARRPLRGALLAAAAILGASAASYRLLDSGLFLPLAGAVSALVLGFGARFLRDVVLDRLRQRELERELDWARTLDGKNRELQAANLLLQEAQARITQLMDGRGNLLEDLPAWARVTAREIARTIGAEDLGVFELHHGEVHPLNEPILVQAPDEAQLRAALQGGGRFAGALVVAAPGLSGELRGALLVLGTFPDGSPERQLLQGFASQLGSALEMIQVRQQLVAAEATRGRSLEELHAQGIATLRLCPKCGRCFPHTSERCETDGHELETPGVIPLRLQERYQLERRLGEGGMGTVYQAQDLTLLRPVAIKLMRPELFRDARARLRFDREARTLVQAQHPNVVAVFDSGQLESGSAYLVMEHLSGLDLAQALERFGPGTPRQIARFLRQAGQALDTAHAMRIVHRDIKPQNLFLVPAPDGFTAKILDFGLAKFQEEEAKVTQTGFMMGTPAYMAPEQVLGQEADERSDLYAFATVVYEALVGRPTLSRGDLGRAFHCILYSTPIPATELAPYLPAPVDVLFGQALAKDPRQRPPRLYDWAQALADQLEALEVPFPGWPIPIPGGDLHPPPSEAATPPDGTPTHQLQPSPTATLDLPTGQHPRPLST